MLWLLGATIQSSIHVVEVLNHYNIRSYTRVVRFHCSNFNLSFGVTSVSLFLCSTLVKFISLIKWILLLSAGKSRLNVFFCGIWFGALFCFARYIQFSWQLWRVLCLCGGISSLDLHQLSAMEDLIHSLELQCACYMTSTRYKFWSLEPYEPLVMVWSLFTIYLEYLKLSED